MSELPGIKLLVITTGHTPKLINVEDVEHIELAPEDFELIRVVLRDGNVIETTDDIQYIRQE